MTEHRGNTTKDVHGPPRLTSIDVFAGVGGMSLGFEQAGFDVLAAVDSDPVHLAAHRFNFPMVEPLCSDAHEVTGDALVSAAERGWRRLHPTGPGWSGRLDCLFGGPSCQGFSVIGRRDAANSRNQLVFEFARLVREISPRYFVLENVPGLLSPAYRSIVATLVTYLESSGYDLGGGPFVLNASSFGVPQIRRRVFIVGAHRGERTPSRAQVVGDNVTVVQALGDLPDADRFEELLESDEATTRADASGRDNPLPSEYVVTLREGPLVDEHDLSTPRRWDRSKITASRRTVHASETSRRFAALAPGSRDPVARLTRLRADEPSPTLRAGTGRDHGSFTSARPIHYEHPRVITVREAARLHSFPDWFRFHVTKWHGFRQVGNSVPPMLARAVAREVAGAASDIPPAVRRQALELGDPKLLTLSSLKAAELFGLDPRLLPPDVRRMEGRAG